MQLVEFTGKTTEDALRAAEEHFGLSLDQLEVEVVRAGSNGFFGLLGAKKAVVRARPQGKSAADEVAEMVAMVTENTAGLKKAPARLAPATPPRPQATRGAQPAPRPAPQAPPRPKPEVKAAVHPPARPTPAAPPAPREAIAPANQSSEVAPGAPPPTAAPETHPAEAAHDQAELLEFGREVLERLAQALDSNASVEAIKGEHGPGLSIMGADSGIVIGRRGQTLDALQYLTTRIVSHKYGKAVHLIVDSGGYRQRRRSALEEAARRMADKARSSRRPQSIGPLNSQERRLVHVVLRSQRGISTVSRGKGELKKVVITPR